MADSIPSEIYSSLKNTVADISVENGFHYTIGDTFLVWADPGEMATKAPCACVLTSGEEVENQVGMNTRVRLNWLIAACIKEESDVSKAALNLQNDIQKAVMSDVRRGGSATMTVVDNTLHSYGSDRRVVYVVVRGSCIYHDR